MLSAKELMHMEDLLTMEQTWIKSLYSFANELQDPNAKQVLQQIAEKNQNHFQAIAKNLNAGQTLQ